MNKIVDVIGSGCPRPSVRLVQKVMVSSLLCYCDGEGTTQLQEYENCFSSRKRMKVASLVLPDEDHTSDIESSMELSLGYCPIIAIYSLLAI